MESAKHTVTFCKLPEAYQNMAAIERWDDVPPVSENHEKARDETIKRLQYLFKQ